MAAETIIWSGLVVRFFLNNFREMSLRSSTFLLRVIVRHGRSCVTMSKEYANTLKVSTGLMLINILLNPCHLVH
jgi:hypothetical protein